MPPRPAGTKLFPSSIPANLSQIQIPLEHTTLKEFHQGTNGRLIIHIQDAHSNLSGQKSLAGALDQMISRYGISLVLVEGSSTDVTLDELKKIGTRDQWKRAANRLLYEGLISGEEYLNLTSDHPIRLMGIESQDLYDASLETYADLVAKRLKTLNYLRRIRLALDRVKNKLYPRQLLAYEAGRAEGEEDFNLRVGRLLELADASQVTLGEAFAEIAKLKGLRAREKRIDFDAANREQEQLMQLVLRGKDEESKKSFLEAGRRARTQPVAMAAYLRGLWSAAEASGASRENYPALTEYAGYLEAFGLLKMDALLEELDLLEDTVYKTALADSEEGRMTRACDRFIGLLQKAYQIKMSSSEFASLKLNEKDFSTKLILGFINRKLLDLGFTEDLTPYQSPIEDARASLEKFYTLVDQRDRAFLEKSEKDFADLNQTSAFFISGGYHTEHLTRLWRQQGYSYLVLTPVVTYETDQAQYEDLLLAPLKFAKRKSRSAEAEDDETIQIAKSNEPAKVTDGVRKAGLISSDGGVYGARFAAVVQTFFSSEDSSVLGAKLSEYVERESGPVVPTKSSSAEVEVESPAVSIVTGQVVERPVESGVAQEKKRKVSFKKALAVTMAAWSLIGLSLYIICTNETSFFNAPVRNTVIGSAVGAVTLMYAFTSAWIKARLFGPVVIDAQNNKVAQVGVEKGAKYMFTMAVVIGPFFEEVVFRAALMPVIFRTLEFILAFAGFSTSSGVISAAAVTGALVISSIAFSKAHTNESWRSFIDRFVAGMLYGAARWMTGSFVTGFIAHAIYNSVPAASLIRAIKNKSNPTGLGATSVVESGGKNIGARLADKSNADRGKQNQIAASSDQPTMELWGRPVQITDEVEVRSMSGELLGYRNKYGNGEIKVFNEAPYSSMAYVPMDSIVINGETIPGVRQVLQNDRSKLEAIAAANGMTTDELLIKIKDTVLNLFRGAVQVAVDDADAIRLWNLKILNDGYESYHIALNKWRVRVWSNLINRHQDLYYLSEDGEIRHFLSMNELLDHFRRGEKIYKRRKGYERPDFPSTQTSFTPGSGVRYLVPAASIMSLQSVGVSGGQINSRGINVDVSLIYYTPENPQVPRGLRINRIVLKFLQRGIFYHDRPEKKNNDLRKAKHGLADDQYYPNDVVAFCRDHLRLTIPADISVQSTPENSGDTSPSSPAGSRLANALTESRSDAQPDAGGYEQISTRILRAEEDVREEIRQLTDSVESAMEAWDNVERQNKALETENRKPFWKRVWGGKKIAEAAKESRSKSLEALGLTQADWEGQDRQLYMIQKIEDGKKLADSKIRSAFKGLEQDVASQLSSELDGSLPDDLRMGPDKYAYLAAAVLDSSTQNMWDIFSETIDILLKQQDADKRYYPGAGALRPAGRDDWAPDEVQFELVKKRLSGLFGEIRVDALSKRIVESKRRQIKSALNQIVSVGISANKRVKLGRLLFEIDQKNPSLRPELAPILLLNSWREAGYNSSEFLPYQEGSSKESPVLNYVNSLTDSDLETIRSLPEPVPGLLDLIALIRTAKHNFNRRYIRVAETDEYEQYLEALAAALNERHASRSSGGDESGEDSYEPVTADRLRSDFSRGVTYMDPEVVGLMTSLRREYLGPLYKQNSGDPQKDEKSIPNMEYEACMRALGKIVTYTIVNGSEDAKMMAADLMDFASGSSIIGESHPVLEAVLSAPATREIKEKLLKAVAAKSRSRDTKSIGLALAFLRSLPSLKEQFDEADLRQCALNVVENFTDKKSRNAADYDEAIRLFSEFMNMDPAMVGKAIEFIDQISMIMDPSRAMDPNETFGSYSAYFTGAIFEDYLYIVSDEGRYKSTLELIHMLRDEGYYTFEEKDLRVLPTLSAELLVKDLKEVTQIDSLFMYKIVEGGADGKDPITSPYAVWAREKGALTLISKYPQTLENPEVENVVKQYLIETLPGLVEGFVFDGETLTVQSVFDKLRSGDEFRAPGRALKYVSLLADYLKEAAKTPMDAAVAERLMDFMRGMESLYPQDLDEIYNWGRLPSLIQSAKSPSGLQKTLELIRILRENHGYVYVQSDFMGLFRLAQNEGYLDEVRSVDRDQIQSRPSVYKTTAFVQHLLRYPESGRVVTNPVNIFRIIDTISQDDKLVTNLLRTEILGMISSVEQLDEFAGDLAYWVSHGNEENLKGIIGTLLDQSTRLTNKSAAAPGELGGFSSDRLNGLVLDVIHSRKPRIGNVIREYLSTYQLNENDGVFVDFASNRNIDIRVRTDVTVNYMELTSVRVLADQRTEESDRDQILKKSVEDTLKNVNEKIKIIVQEVDPLTNKPVTPTQRKKLAKKITSDVDLLREKVLRYFLNRDLSDSEKALLDDEETALKIFTIVSVAATLDNVNYGQTTLAQTFVRRAFEALLGGYRSAVDAQKGQSDALQNAKRELNGYILNLSAADVDGMYAEHGSQWIGADSKERKKGNKEIVDDLVAGGVDRRLWLDGLSLRVTLKDGVTEESKREAVHEMSHEMVEIAMSYGIKQIHGQVLDLATTPAGIRTHREAQAFYTAMESTEEFEKIPENIRQRLVEDVLDGIMRVEAMRVSADVTPADYEIAIRKDYLNEATAGLRVSGCFAPDGVHREMPLVHAGEANVFFIQVNDAHGVQAANAVMVLGADKAGAPAAYVYSKYADPNNKYDVDEAFAQAVIWLTQYVPTVILDANSAGFVRLKKHLEFADRDIVLSKPSTVFQAQYYDHSASLSHDGDLRLEFKNPMVLTRETVNRKGLLPAEAEPVEESEAPIMNTADLSPSGSRLAEADLNEISGRYRNALISRAESNQPFLRKDKDVKELINSIYGATDPRYRDMVIDATNHFVVKEGGAARQGAQIVLDAAVVHALVNHLVRKQGAPSGRSLSDAVKAALKGDLDIIAGMVDDYNVYAKKLGIRPMTPELAILSGMSHFFNNDKGYGELNAVLGDIPGDLGLRVLALNLFFTGAHLVGGYAEETDSHDFEMADEVGRAIEAIRSGDHPAQTVRMLKRGLMKFMTMIVLRLIDEASLNSGQIGSAVTAIKEVVDRPENMSLLRGIFKEEGAAGYKPVDGDDTILDPWLAGLGWVFFDDLESSIVAAQDLPGRSYSGRDIGSLLLGDLTDPAVLDFVRDLRRDLDGMENVTAKYMPENLDRIQRLATYLGITGGARLSAAAAKSVQGSSVMINVDGLERGYTRSEGPFKEGAEAMIYKLTPVTGDGEDIGFLKNRSLAAVVEKENRSSFDRRIRAFEVIAQLSENERKHFPEVILIDRDHRIDKEKRAIVMEYLSDKGFVKSAADLKRVLSRVDSEGNVTERSVEEKMMLLLSLVEGLKILSDHQLIFGDLKFPNIHLDDELLDPSITWSQELFLQHPVKLVDMGGAIEKDGVDSVSLTTVAAPLNAGLRPLNEQQYKNLKGSYQDEKGHRRHEKDEWLSDFMSRFRSQEANKFSLGLMALQTFMPDKYDEIHGFLNHRQLEDHMNAVEEILRAAHPARSDLGDGELTAPWAAVLRKLVNPEAYFRPANPLETAEDIPTIDLIESTLREYADQTQPQAAYGSRLAGPVEGLIEIVGDHELRYSVENVDLGFHEPLILMLPSETKVKVGGEYRGRSEREWIVIDDKKTPLDRPGHRTRNEKYFKPLIDRAAALGKSGLATEDIINQIFIMTSNALGGMAQGDKDRLVEKNKVFANLEAGQGDLNALISEKVDQVARKYKNQDVPIGYFIKHRMGVCRHRAILFKELAAAAGLKVQMKNGRVLFGGRHAWDEVELENGDSYFVDAFFYPDIVYQRATAEKASPEEEERRGFKQDEMMVSMYSVASRVMDRFNVELRPMGGGLALVITPIAVGGAQGNVYGRLSFNRASLEAQGFKHVLRQGAYSIDPSGDLKPSAEPAARPFKKELPVSKFTYFNGDAYYGDVEFKIPTAKLTLQIVTGEDSKRYVQIVDGQGTVLARREQALKEGDYVDFGRDGNNALQVPKKVANANYVSRFHGVVRVFGGNVYVEDNGSRNGTRFNRRLNSSGSDGRSKLMVFNGARLAADVKGKSVSPDDSEAMAGILREIESRGYRFDDKTPFNSDGSTAVIYRAVRVADGRSVAIKIAKLDDPWSNQYLANTNIFVGVKRDLFVDLLDAGSVPPQSGMAGKKPVNYQVMELLDPAEWVTLRSLSPAQSPFASLSPQAAFDLLLGIMDAVDRTKRDYGRDYTDISLDNLMVNPTTGAVKFVDLDTFNLEEGKQYLHVKIFKLATLAEAILSVNPRIMTPTLGLGREVREFINKAKLNSGNFINPFRNITVQTDAAQSYWEGMAGRLKELRELSVKAEYLAEKKSFEDALQARGIPIGEWPRELTTAFERAFAGDLEGAEDKYYLQILTLGAAYYDLDSLKPPHPSEGSGARILWIGKRRAAADAIAVSVRRRFVEIKRALDNQAKKSARSTPSSYPYFTAYLTIRAISGAKDLNKPIRDIQAVYPKSLPDDEMSGINDGLMTMIQDEEASSRVDLTPARPSAEELEFGSEPVRAMLNADKKVGFTTVRLLDTDGRAPSNVRMRLPVSFVEYLGGFGNNLAAADGRKILVNGMHFFRDTASVSKQSPEGVIVAEIRREELDAALKQLGFGKDQGAAVFSDRDTRERIQADARDEFKKFVDEFAEKANIAALYDILAGRSSAESSAVSIALPAYRRFIDPYVVIAEEIAQRTSDAYRQYENYLKGRVSDDPQILVNLLRDPENQELPAEYRASGSLQSTRKSEQWLALNHVLKLFLDHPEKVQRTVFVTTVEWWMELYEALHAKRGTAGYDAVLRAYDRTAAELVELAQTPQVESGIRLWTEEALDDLRKTEAWEKFKKITTVRIGADWSRPVIVSESSAPSMPAGSTGSYQQVLTDAGYRLTIPANMIGRGATANVFEAEKDGKKYAVKIPKVYGNKKIREWFNRETEIGIAAMEKGLPVPRYYSGVDGIVVMDMVRGVTLTDALAMSVPNSRMPLITQAQVNEAVEDIASQFKAKGLPFKDHEANDGNFMLVLDELGNPVLENGKPRVLAIDLAVSMGNGTQAPAAAGFQRGARLAGETELVRLAEFLQIVRILELGRTDRIGSGEAQRRFDAGRAGLEAILAMIGDPRRRVLENGGEYPLLAAEAELLLTVMGGEGIYYGEQRLWTPEQADLTPIAAAEKRLILPGESIAPQSDMEVRREIGSWMSYARLLAGKDPSGASEVLLTLPGNTDQEVLSLLRRIFVDTQKDGGPLTLHIELVSSAEEIKSIRSQYPNAKYGGFFSNNDLKNAAYQAEIRGGIPLGFAEDQAANLQLDYGRHIPALVALVLLSAQKVPDVQRFKEQLFVKRSPILMMDNAALRSLLDVLDQAKQILTALNFLLKPDVTRTILIQKLRDLEAVASMA